MSTPWAVVVIQLPAPRTVPTSGIRSAVSIEVCEAKSSKGREGKRRLEGKVADVLAIHRDAIESFEQFADELGHEPGDVALGWLLHQPAVTAPIVGPRTTDQLAAAVRALDVTLDTDALARLDQIFPGRKTAPEDYAW
jgi:aryl-alcohol dehydrogenase-like predicted oxidoreductase